MVELLRHFIILSEKAANLARACRDENKTFKVLVIEKDERDKNPKFKHDFKTFADVLIQETLKRDIEILFPELKGNIHGEETPKFQLPTGNEVEITMCEDRNGTKEMLSQILGPEFSDLVDRLSYWSHCLPDPFTINIVSEIPNLDLNCNCQKLGVWIDPIDGTAEYVEGAPNNIIQGIVVKGLGCSCILIGAYCLETGMPILGVVNTPFVGALSIITWGINFNGVSAGNLGAAENGHNLALVGYAESEELVVALETADWTVLRVAGAGNKLLTVARGMAALAITSGPTLYAWDTCAPHALLSTRGGGIVNYSSLAHEGNAIQLNYTKETKHLGGAVAYRDPTALQRLRSVKFPPKDDL